MGMKIANKYLSMGRALTVGADGVTNNAIHAQRDHNVEAKTTCVHLYRAQGSELPLFSFLRSSVSIEIYVGETKTAVRITLCKIVSLGITLTPTRHLTRV